MSLADPNRVRCDLHEVVVLDPLDGRLQGESAGRFELDGVVGAGRPDVGQLLGLRRVGEEHLGA